MGSGIGVPDTLGHETGTLNQFFNEPFGESYRLERDGRCIHALAFEVVAALLSAIGIYGVLSCMTAQRRPEIRMALGRSAKEIFRLIVGERLPLLIFGLVTAFGSTAEIRRSRIGGEMDTLETNRPFRSANFFRGDNALLLYLALLKLCIHLATNLFGGYGYIRDELYYIACSDHLAWGYVDHPPFSVFLLRLSRLLFGDSLFALRLLPAVSGAVTVTLAGLITRELGGGRYAQVLTSACVIAAPLVLGMDSMFSLNSFEILFWTLAFYWIVLIVKRDRQEYWVFLGLTLGLGLLNKISVAWLGAGLIAGLLLSPNRKLFLTRKPWLAGALAFLIFLPYVLWQPAHGWPTLEFIRNAGSGKYIALSPFDLFLQQSLFMDPLTLPVWFSGCIYFLASRSVRPFRILPIVYLTVFLILAMSRNVKTVYLVPAFPMLFTLGGFTVEKFILRFNLRWLKPVTVALVLCSGAAFAPLVLAVLPVETFIRYSQTLGLAPSTSENHTLNRLPQYYADMFGWEKMARTVAGVYSALPPEDKEKCAILCNNYGEAGAIDFFGRKYHLPQALCGHNNYWFWRPANATGELVIILGGTAEEHSRTYGNVVQAGLFQDDYCMPYENNLPVWVCRKRQVPLSDDWASFKVLN